MLIDAHAHLLDSSFLKDRDKVIAKAKKAGVGLIVENGLTLANNKMVLDFASGQDVVVPAIGLNPVDASKISDVEFDKVLKFLKANAKKVVAFGEIGVDFYWIKDKEARGKMIERFERILDLAEELRKPVIIHSRSSSAISLVLGSLSNRDLDGLLHAFSGTIKQAQRAAKIGFLVGINPNVVRSKGAQRVVEEIPLASLMTESDAPYLGPSREERNEPANVKLAIEKIAELKKVSTKRVEKEIEQNFKRVFGSTL